VYTGGPMTSYVEEAPMGVQMTWDNVDWQYVTMHVNKLQVRIAKAVKAEKHHLVKRLQYLLKNSFLAKLLAVRRVTTNKGKNTPGIDGVIWKTPKQKLKAVHSLRSKKYKARPLKRTYIEKREKKKKRPLGIPTMYDRAMQALHALTLEPIAEVTADRSSFGFRKYRSAQDAAEYAFNCLALKDRAAWILEGDIRGCFDNINHEWLYNNVPMDKKVLKEFLASGYVYKNKLFTTEAGTPQGGIASPILANMALDGMERAIKERYWSSGTGRIHKDNNKHKVNLIRYADDFIVTADSKEVAEDVKKVIAGFLAKRGLMLSEEKTRITHIDDGFDFLGWNFRKYRGKLLIKPSKTTCKNIADKVRQLIRKHIAIAQDDLIKILNPVVRGWCNYHSCMVSKEAFYDLDGVLFRALWKWARRRHPTKSRWWIKDRYWVRKGSRDWIFSRGETTLITAGYTKIERHLLIKLDKIPFLKEDKEYFTGRKADWKKRWRQRSA
jgi:RNA-directed DNA polymerase